ncbi:hypothetical protein AXF42_Ash016351 [Apostasia shenzhenica]|uniref:Uncharacterized protein n=1 Tax=Apostasia shenzhenica TaxID=1088818 RepID=A0A2H9ZZU8_9ASPA|nr:hypothetical protein AXF42_Ash016351 [Apostasia shenzhenica]
MSISQKEHPFSSSKTFSFEGELGIQMTACAQNKLSCETVAMRSSPQYRSFASDFVTDSFDSEDAREPSFLEPPRVGKYIASTSATDEMSMSDGSYSPRTLDIPKFLLDKAEDNLREFVGQEMKSLVSHSDKMKGNSSFLSNHNVDSTVQKDLHVFRDHNGNLSVGGCKSDVSCNQVSMLANFDISNSNKVDASDQNVDSGTQDVLQADNRMPVPVLANPAKLNVVLLSVQQRVLTAKTDIEGLIVQLFQEKHAKDCLMSEVKNLEDELKASKQISEDNLQQAILTERGKVTSFQWDNAEILSKIWQIESRIKFEECQRVRAESERVAASVEKELLSRELNGKAKHLQNLRKRLEEMELKSREDLKVLVKEVKSLMRSQESIRGLLSQRITENIELKEEKQRMENAITASNKCICAFGTLRCRLEESSINFLAEDEEKFSVNSSSIPDALGLLKTSDNRISLLLAEAEHLAQEENLQMNWFLENHSISIVDDLEKMNYKMRRLLSETIIDNAKLTRQMNSIFRCTLNAATQLESIDDKDSLARRKPLRWFSKQ